MIYSDLSRNMEELFKLNEKYSVMYLTIVCDDTKLLNINEIHFYLFIYFLQYLIPPTGCESYILVLCFK